jgi:hypothetical protein
MSKRKTASVLIIESDEKTREGRLAVVTAPVNINTIFELK